MEKRKKNILIISGIVFLVLVIGVVVFTTIRSTQEVSIGSETTEAVIPITGSSGTVNLVCGSTTVFELENGGKVSFPKIEPCELSVAVSPARLSELPDDLPSGMTFIDAASVAVIKNGQEVEFLPANKKVTLSFSQHSDDIGAKYLGVLRWDEANGWEEVSFDSHLKAFSNMTGVFVLVEF